MRRFCKIIVIAFVLIVLGYLGYSILTKMQYKNEVAKTLQNIPEFSFKTLENTNFTNANLKPNVATIFIYFNSECDYCQHEAQSISDSIKEFKDVQLLFVSTEPIETIKTFAKTYKLINLQNTTFLYDSAHNFSNRFDANSIPFILIYNKDQELVKKHKGQLKAEAILSTLITSKH